jgi:sterol desaturase/sphingolipid hydroxylase (fatty acid hydroxylase superfamily)
MAETIKQIMAVMLSTGWFILICTLLERLSPREEFQLAARWPGILFGLLAPAFAILVAIPLSSLWQSLGVPPLLRLPLSDWLGTAGGVLAVLLVVDFLMYWEHRFEHRFLWPVHAVHHSVEHLSAATSYSHPLQYVPVFLFIAVPLSLIEFGSVAIPATVSTLTAFLQLLIHSPVKISFGPFRHLVVDPAYHRIHHSLEEQHFDRNFSILFSIWDRLFGTQVLPERGEWPATGIHEAPSPRSLGELLAFPFRLWARRAGDAAKGEATLPPAAVEANRPSGLGV